MICVISKATFGDYDVHDIQTIAGWESNPYGDVYAIVPPDLVDSIMKTHGFCDIELSASGEEIVSFTPREIPEIPVTEEPATPAPQAKDIYDELAQAYNEGVQSA